MTCHSAENMLKYKKGGRFVSFFASDRATALIDTRALAANFNALGNYVKTARKPPRIMAVVKADAYGHGASTVVPVLLAAGCIDFATATADEALIVRKLAPFANILVLGYTPPKRARQLAAAGVTQTVFSLDYAQALSSVLIDAALAVHFKIDGGMCRLGFDAADIAGIRQAAALPHLLPRGLFTHFPAADTDPGATAVMLERFIRCRTDLAGSGLALFAHAAASAAMLTLPDSWLDAVRPGIALYGVPPVKTDLPLSPVLSLTAPVVQIHTVPAGTPVGYGGCYVTKRESRIAAVPIGYADGFFRALTGFSVTVSHRNNRFSCPVVGSVCMDQLMLDVTDTPAAVGDTVLLYDDPRPVAAALGTIPYEVLTALSGRVKRSVK